MNNYADVMHVNLAMGGNIPSPVCAMGQFYKQEVGVITVYTSKSIIPKQAQTGPSRSKQVQAGPNLRLDYGIHLHEGSPHTWLPFAS